MYHFSAIAMRIFQLPLCARILAGCMALIWLLSGPAFAQQTIVWPDGNEVAVSLSFDDGRASQLDAGLPLFEQFDVAVTFYVMPGSVEQRLAGWKRAAADGHEIGNHSLHHPCSGNFEWSRDHALEAYTMDEMRAELLESNRQLEELFGKAPESFAYPCGQTYVGRGKDTRSYVPLVSGIFASGRGWLDEAPNDPAYVDMAQLTGVEMDGKTFDQIRAFIEQARAQGGWLVLAGHDVGRHGVQTTRLQMLERLIRYANEPSNRVWLAPVGTVAAYVLEERGAGR